MKKSDLKTDVSVFIFPDTFLGFSGKANVPKTFSSIFFLFLRRVFLVGELLENFNGEVILKHLVLNELWSLLTTLLEWDFPAPDVRLNSLRSRWVGKSQFLQDGILGSKKVLISHFLDFFSYKRGGGEETTFEIRFKW